MDLTNEKLVFQLVNKKNGNIIYQHEIELLEFQKEMLQNEKVSFFYTFKDMSIELEDAITSKLILGDSKDEVSFVIKCLDKILNESILDVVGIEDKDMEKNEVQLYFIFEKISKSIINKISEEHKNIILSNIERN